MFEANSWMNFVADVMRKPGESRNSENQTSKAAIDSGASTRLS